MAKEDYLRELFTRYPNMYNPANCTFTEAAMIYLDPSPCQGNGDCIDGLCVCFPGYRGSNDFMTLEHLACHYNSYAEEIFYSVIAVTVLIWAVGNLRAAWYKRKQFMNQRMRKRTDGGKFAFLKDCFDFFPFRVLIPNGAFASTFFFIYCGLKTFTSNCVGVDVGVTISLYISGTIGFFAIQDTGLEQFSRLAKGSLSRSSKGKKIMANYRRIVRVGEAFYVLGKLIVFVYIAIPDKPFHPIVKPFLVITNLWLAIYFLLFAIGQRIVTNKMEEMQNEMITSIAADSTGAATPQSRSTRKLLKALVFMKKSNKSSKVSLVVMTIILSFFMSPYGWPWQNFAPMIAFALSFPANIKHGKSFMPQGDEVFASSRPNAKSQGATGSQVSSGSDVETENQSFAKSSYKTSQVTPA